MSYSNPMTLPYQSIMHALATAAVDGVYLEPGEGSVYQDPEHGMVVRIPASHRKEFFRQLFLDFGEDIASSLMYRHKSAPDSGVLYFPNVTLQGLAA